METRYGGWVWLAGILLVASALSALLFFLVVAPKQHARGGATAREAGRGANGQSAPGGGSEEDHLHFLAFDNQSEPVIYVGTHTGLSASRDGGRTWQELGLRGRDVMNVAINEATAGRMVVGGHLVFVRTRDGGNTWETIGKDLPGADIHGLAGSHADPWVLYAYVVDKGLFRSRDEGLTWEKAGDPPGGRIMSLAVDEQDPRVVYAGDMERGIYRSVDGGRTWEEANQGLTDRAVTALEVGPGQPSILFAATGSGLFRSEDRGRTWRPAGDWPAGVGVQALAAARSQGKVYALQANGGLMVSGDFGKTWSSLN